MFPEILYTILTPDHARPRAQNAPQTSSVLPNRPTPLPGCALLAGLRAASVSEDGDAFAARVAVENPYNVVAPTATPEFALAARSVQTRTGRAGEAPRQLQRHTFPTLTLLVNPSHRRPASSYLC